MDAHWDRAVLLTEVGESKKVRACRTQSRGSVATERTWSVCSTCSQRRIAACCRGCSKHQAAGLQGCRLQQGQSSVMRHLLRRPWTRSSAWPCCGRPDPNVPKHLARLCHARGDSSQAIQVRTCLHAKQSCRSACAASARPRLRHSVPACSRPDHGSCQRALCTLPSAPSRSTTRLVAQVLQDFLAAHRAASDLTHVNILAEAAHAHRQAPGGL